MQRIAYILRSYPRLSQTFIVNEILSLEQLGLNLHLFAITNPHEPIVQEYVTQVRAPVEYLEQTAKRERAAVLAEHAWVEQQVPDRYAATHRYVEQNANLDEGYTSASRFECFDYAVHVAGLLERERRVGQPIEHLHAHFAHDPTLIALLVHMLTGVSFSFTAHARDLVQIPPQALIERIDQATFVLTCSGTNVDYVNGVVPELLRAKVHLIHHGVNLDGFQPLLESTKDTKKIPNLGIRVPSCDFVDQSGKPPLILSVGRLVEKKGFPDLIAACAQLKQVGRQFRCEIYGEGPLRDQLAALIDQLELADCVRLAGERGQAELIPIFQHADIFALAPFVTGDGDRDGIPNVLVEAMACGLPVISTTVAGIPELVRHGENGLLVAPHDVSALVDALATLLSDSPRRERMGVNARAAVVAHFDLRAAARKIAALFAQTVGDKARISAPDMQDGQPTIR
ncbi:MAG: glycosyltransferase family 4 protein [Roseiflexaceae bacterium]